jgi:hypothetical protein
MDFIHNSGPDLLRYACLTIGAIAIHLIIGNLIDSIKANLSSKE